MVVDIAASHTLAVMMIAAVGVKTPLAKVRAPVMVAVMVAAASRRGVIGMGSEEGVGSTFTVRLPRVAVKTKDLAKNQTGVMA